jgi:hypothetical protein
MSAETEHLRRKQQMISLPETQHQEDYEPVPDPNCEMNRLGFTAGEIDTLIGELADV